MATFLDTGLVGSFSVIFTFLLVYAILWGVLTTRKDFGDNKGLYAIISLAGAFFMVISPFARAFIETVTPWFLVMAIVFFLIMVSVSVFSEVKWINVLNDPVAKTWIIILIVVVMVVGVAQTFGQFALDAGTGVQTNNIPVMTEDGQMRDAAPDLGVLSQNAAAPGSTATGNYELNLVNTLVHPKVLGLIIIFVLSAIIVYFLSKPYGGIG